MDIINFLRTVGDSEISKFNLSDVPEFLSKNERIDLWKEVIRSGKNKSLILYRSFSPNFLIPREYSKNFSYLAKQSEYLSKKEMTGSYSGVYLYEIHK